MKLSSPKENHALQLALRERGLGLMADGPYVHWESSSPRHPRNWSQPRKLYDFALVLFLELLAYLLGQGLGSIVFPPYSETFGRKKLYIVSTGLYAAFCVLIGACPIVAVGAVGRFITGLLSAIPTTVIVGIAEDLFDEHDRIWMTFSALVAVIAGLSLGPIVSTFISLRMGWQWIFYISAIITGVTTILLCTTKESRPSVLLTQEVAALRKVTEVESLEPFVSGGVPGFSQFLRTSVLRPLHLFSTEPLVFTVAMTSGLSTALVYLFTQTLPIVYGAFGFREKEVNLPLLAIALGWIPGIFARILDHHNRRRHQENGTLLPEHKLANLAIAAPVFAAALWLFAWTVPPMIEGVHWIVSVIALFLLGYATNEFFVIFRGYLTDSYRGYSSSAFGAITIVRCFLSSTFAVCGSKMFLTLGANVSVSLIAAVATLLCSVLALLPRYGERIRKRSKFAQASLRG